MTFFNYNCFAHLFLSVNDVNKLEPHIYNLEAIKKINKASFSELKFKEYYYFKMPKCGHLKRSSLVYFKTHKLNNTFDKLVCDICKLLKNSQISYGKLKSIYSRSNKVPLHEIKKRGVPVILLCGKCDSVTEYKEIRWVLNNFKIDSEYDYCNNKCKSIGKRYPELKPFWDTNENNQCIFDVVATDENMSHKKFAFTCPLCESISSYTPYNVINNSSRCQAHKNSRTSFAETAIYLSFKRSLGNIPFLSITHQHKYNGKNEFDIYISLKGNNNKAFAIEYDGMFHLGTNLNDDHKSLYAKKNEIHLIRVRELGIINTPLLVPVSIIQRKSIKKIELNDIIRTLLKEFKTWFAKQNILEKNYCSEVFTAIDSGINNVDVIKDELEIYDAIYYKPKKLLKDNITLKPIWEQLHPHFKVTHGNIIAENEQDISRPFICQKCNHEWSQTVKTVVSNYKKTVNGSTGCPSCSNKVKSNTERLILEARNLRRQNLTLIEIGKIINRSQPTLSGWKLDEM
ncbi:hypothetical protein [Rummeliibacillus stabekisii]|uniref:hypothetical protein n=1 Tax=Rummeliibacillus stabekisii TaxID=241244 RepID=UPI001166C1ED|nr:hypothetical protein [Rummeliibacillus stabekisii]MBB5170710.1 transcription elongation factor Elf1 [Rummeliibacillus stabekisii]GEL06204.1 hypothetical protein RST01_28310 [Rummeliibacillus stabekisii]